MEIVMPQLSLLPTVVLVGTGNIGSFTIDALGRVRGLERVVLVDPGFYDESNRRSQSIKARDVGKAKAKVQAKRLREINPGLEVIALVEPIANVPRGWLHKAVVMTALDSVAARRDACEAAWRVGAPVIDGGVEPELGLGRVSVYVPAPDGPCLECDFSQVDYQNMPAKHVCDADEDDETPTNGSPSLGALVGSLMVIELEKMFAGKLEGSLAGRQLVVDVTHHKHYVTQLVRNPRCRFDHNQHFVDARPVVNESMTLGDALEAVRSAHPAGGRISLGVDGRQFAKALHCPSCSAAKDLLSLPERLPLKARRCAQCDGREMLPVGFKQLDRLSFPNVPARALRRSLRSLGIRAGDVLVAGDGVRDNYYEVNMTHPKSTDPILTDFLQQQSVQAAELAAQSDLLAVVPMRGNPPSQYVVEFRCKGLMKDATGAVVESDGPWGFGVNFPKTFLRGGFHPAEVLAYLGPVEQPWHPNLAPRGPFVCMEVRPAMPLTEIIYGLFEFVTWNLFSTHDEGLNHAASQWYRNQDPKRFPIDSRPLKRRALNVTVKPVEPKS